MVPLSWSHHWKNWSMALWRPFFLSAWVIISSPITRFVNLISHFWVSNNSLKDLRTSVQPFAKELFWSCPLQHLWDSFFYLLYQTFLSTESRCNNNFSLTWTSNQRIMNCYQHSQPLNGKHLVPIMKLINDSYYFQNLTLFYLSSELHFST